MKRKLFVLEIAILPDASERQAKAAVKFIIENILKQSFSEEGSFEVTELNRRNYIMIPELSGPCGFFAFKEFDDGEEEEERNEQRLLEEAESN